MKSMSLYTAERGIIRDMQGNIESKEILHERTTNNKHLFITVLYYQICYISIFRDVFSNNKASTCPPDINKKLFFKFVLNGH